MLGYFLGILFFAGTSAYLWYITSYAAYIYAVLGLSLTTMLADPGKITLKRRVDGKETAFKLDAKRMARANGPGDFPVLPGDTITVGESLF